RPTISLDPIFWLPMTFSERSRCLKQLLRSMPDEIDMYLTKDHAFKCLKMYNHLQL
ncbi:hypothetical protein BDF20DRAFT_819593, partial [Mycotypha africana]|uniref:uncharacterized protein n=1 Tax=Mycotypha africana TaxID=64632 RepID=UPI002300EDF7